MFLFLGCDANIADNNRCQFIKKLGYCKQPTAKVLCATTCLCGKLHYNKQRCSTGWNIYTTGSISHCIDTF